jgi:hypothetical protein
MLKRLFFFIAFVSIIIAMQSHYINAMSLDEQVDLIIEKLGIEFSGVRHIGGGEYALSISKIKANSVLESYRKNYPDLFKPGSIIYKINNTPITSLDDFRREVLRGILDQNLKLYWGKIIKKHSGGSEIIMHNQPFTIYLQGLPASGSREICNNCDGKGYTIQKTWCGGAVRDGKIRPPDKIEKRVCPLCGGSGYKK